MIDVKVVQLHPNAKIPTKTDGNIGWDLSCVADETFHSPLFGPKTINAPPYKKLFPGDRHVFRTGLSIALPDGYAGLLWDRSGLAAKSGLHRLAGVIDSSYRGEWLVCLVNLGKDAVEVFEGDRIAQLIIQQEIPATMRGVTELDSTIRGANGFGSSGR